MKKAIFASAFGLMLAGALGACTEPNSAAVTSVIDQIQADVKEACAVVPDTISIANLIAGDPLPNVASYAAEICGAISPTASMKIVRRIDGRKKLVHAPVVVKGVTIRFIE